MRLRAFREHPLLHALGLLVAAGCLIPVLWLVWLALGDGEAVRRVGAAPHAPAIVLRSLLLAGGVGLGSAALALLLAWLTHATDLPGRRLFQLALVLPLAVPSYVTGFVVIALLGPAGLWASQAAGLGLPGPPEVQGLVGVVLALAPSYPLALLPLQAALARMDPAQWDAARSLGATPAAAFARVVLPNLRAPAAAGTLLVGLYVLSDFGAVSLLRYPTLSYVVYLRYKTPFAREEAAGFALLLAACAVVVMIAYHALRGRTPSGASATVPRRWRPVALGVWRWPAAALCAAIVAYGVIVPTGVVVWWLVRGWAAGNPLGSALAPLGTSLAVAALAALFVVAVAVPPALLARVGLSGFAAWVRGCAQAGYALPGIVVAIALVAFGVHWVPALYQTFGLLLFAYVVRFLPLAVETLADGVERQSPRLLDAARSLGCTSRQAWVRIAIPAMRPMLAAAALGVFISVVKELPVTLLLAPPGTATLATRIWSLTAEAYFAAAALPVLFLLVLAVAALLLSPDVRRREA